MAVDSNQKTYTDPQIVRHYAQLQQLQPAEQVLLEALSDRLATMTMLDLGVGGGRTTAHFAPRVADYIGLDYSPAMIAACEHRFPNHTANIRFEVGDVRDLSHFSDHTFDLILFSFNGLDYIEHGDRLLALQEIHRVGKPGGTFIFSSHNLQGIEPLFRWRDRLNWNPIHNYVETVLWVILRSVNRHLSAKTLAIADHAIIKDEPHNFRLANYYIRPHIQRQQLQPYFKTIRIFSWRTGQEITDNTVLSLNRELWLYYACEIKESS